MTKREIDAYICVHGKTKAAQQRDLRQQTAGVMLWSNQNQPIDHTFNEWCVRDVNHHYIPWFELISRIERGRVDTLVVNRLVDLGSADDIAGIKRLTQLHSCKLVTIV